MPKASLRDFPFGLLMPGRDYQSGSGTKEKFTGKELDEETGLNYHGGRFYWLAGGRWLVTDQSIEKFPSLSPYQYSFNNPIIFLDPDGLEPILVSKWWFIFFPHEYLTKSEKEQWYNRLETAKLYYYNMGYSGIAEWISNKNFNVIIYNYYGIESHIGGETKRAKNQIYIGNISSQEIINLVYAHELAHLIGYSEVGAYATSAALLGSSGKHYIIRQLMKYVRSNPQLLKEMPLALRKLFKQMLTKNGIDPQKASVFYQAYVQWGDEILREFEPPSDSSSYDEDNDNWWWRGWGAQYGSPPR